MPQKNLSCTNFKLSALQEHQKSEGHSRPVREEEAEKAKLAGASIAPVRIKQSIPDDSPLLQGLSVISNTERKAITKLHDIVHHTCRKGCPFADFVDLIELEKLHEVKFQASSYENESACRDFINNIADYLFEKDAVEKLKRVNFIALLCNGSTDSSTDEQEVVYVMFVDPDTFVPTLSFFKVLKLETSQDAVGVLGTGLEEVLGRLLFLSSDGVSVSSGKKSGIIVLFKETYVRISFIWCFSLRLELAIEKALKKFTEPVEKTLRHLYYLYKKSSKKH